MVPASRIMLRLPRGLCRVLCESSFNVAPFCGTAVELSSAAVRSGQSGFVSPGHGTEQGIQSRKPGFECADHSMNMVDGKCMAQVFAAFVSLHKLEELGRAPHAGPLATAASSETNGYSKPLLLCTHTMTRGLPDFNRPHLGQTS